ncbi:hypothetical protein Srubr_25170 [Streptomyces rubradiris]|uniref:Erythromycin biosynthesis protein CIII-like N-terminal domain-containing protein n=1 Tax=Streptomyces rubradiris TaxID=285531 RepID=A0ABQ3R9X8_STRRR|nr:hypothetical protein GCM10018792_78140 [Streptomyces rubradiris]GHI52671.1 hypothetical protein Srubr_25170 [Streptomyces rubradiris]
MRFLFTTFAWSSHYYPMVPLGWALQAAGHEVRVATTPSLVDAVVTTGLPAVAVGKDIDIVGRAGSGKLHDHERWPTDRDKVSCAEDRPVGVDRPLPAQHARPRTDHGPAAARPVCALQRPRCAAGMAHRAADSASRVHHLGHLDSADDR